MKNLWIFEEHYRAYLIFTFVIQIYKKFYNDNTAIYSFKLTCKHHINKTVHFNRSYGRVVRAPKHADILNKKCILSYNIIICLKRMRTRVL